MSAVLCATNQSAPRGVTRDAVSEVDFRRPISEQLNFNRTYIEGSTTS